MDTDRDKDRVRPDEIEALNAAFNAAIAAERENVRLRGERMQQLTSECVVLREQLAAERGDRKSRSEEAHLRLELEQQFAAELERTQTLMDALKLAADLALDVRQQHADPNDNFYNDCDHNECRWCSNSHRIDAALAKVKS